MHLLGSKCTKYYRFSRDLAKVARPQRAYDCWSLDVVSSKDCLLTNLYAEGMRWPYEGMKITFSIFRMIMTFTRIKKNIFVTWKLFPFKHKAYIIIDAYKQYWSLTEENHSVLSQRGKLRPWCAIIYWSWFSLAIGTHWYITFCNSRASHDETSILLITDNDGRFIILLF